jgi:hypothetical protein
MIILLEQKGFSIDEELNYKFLSLLCQFEKSSAFSFLKNTHNYDVDKCLELVTKHNIIECKTYLLERIGKIDDSIKLFLENLKEKFYQLKFTLCSGNF